MYLGNLLFSSNVKSLSFLRPKQSLYQLDQQIPSYIFLKTPLNLVPPSAWRSLASPQQMQAHSITALLRKDSHPWGQPYSIQQEIKTTPRVVLAEAAKGSLHSLSPPTQSNFGSWGLPVSKYCISEILGTQILPLFPGIPQETSPC